MNHFHFHSNFHAQPIHPLAAAYAAGVTCVARLKIDPADVNSGYRPVGGSKRVYKIELNGEMRAAKVGWDFKTVPTFVMCTAAFCVARRNLACCSAVSTLCFAF